MGNKALTPEEQYAREQEAIDRCNKRIKKSQGKKEQLIETLMENIDPNFFGEWETTYEGVDLTIVASKGQLKLKNKNEHTEITIIDFINYDNIQVRFEDEEQTIAIFQYVKETDTLKMIIDETEEILWVRVSEEDSDAKYSSDTDTVNDVDTVNVDTVNVDTVEGLFMKRYS